MTERRILLIDDHPLFRIGVRSMLAQAGMSVLVHEATSVRDALGALAEMPDFGLILYDWHLHGGGGGVKGLLAVMQTAPEVPLLVISADEDEAIKMAAITLGAVDFVSKAADPRTISDLLWRWLNRPMGMTAAVDAHALHATSATATATALTHRQHEVLSLMAQGEANKCIAAQLRIAETTVRAHVSDILRLLHAHNRTEAVVVATRTGLLDGWTAGPASAAPLPSHWN